MRKVSWPKREIGRGSTKGVTNFTNLPNNKTDLCSTIVSKFTYVIATIFTFKIGFCTVRIDIELIIPEKVCVIIRVKRER